MTPLSSFGPAAEPPPEAAGMARAADTPGVAWPALWDLGIGKGDYHPYPE